MTAAWTASRAEIPAARKPNRGPGPYPPASRRESPGRSRRKGHTHRAPDPADAGRSNDTRSPGGLRCWCRHPLFLSGSVPENDGQVRGADARRQPRTWECWNLQRPSRPAGLDFREHSIYTRGWSVQASQTLHRIVPRAVLSRLLQSLVDGAPNPLAFGYPAALSRLMQLCIQLRGNQYLQPMAHMSMLTYSNTLFY